MIDIEDTAAQLCLGVSACLLGHRTRYDGGHRFKLGLANLWAGGIKLKALCPEVEAGFSCPRPPAHLGGSLSSPRFIITNSGEDVSAVLEKAIAFREAQGLWEEVDGFILKARSPSCAPDRHSPAHPGPGPLALAIKRSQPDLPLADESVFDGQLEHFLNKCLIRIQARLKLKS